MGLPETQGAGKIPTPPVRFPSPTPWQQLDTLGNRYIAEQKKLSPALRQTMLEAYRKGVTPQDFDRMMSSKGLQGEYQRWCKNPVRKQFLEALHSTFRMSYDSQNSGIPGLSQIMQWFYKGFLDRYQAQGIFDDDVIVYVRLANPNLHPDDRTFLMRYFKSAGQLGKRTPALREELVRRSIALYSEVCGTYDGSVSLDQMMKRLAAYESAAAPFMHDDPDSERKIHQALLREQLHILRQRMAGDRSFRAAYQEIQAEISKLEKARGRELTVDQLHDIIQDSFGKTPPGHPRKAVLFLMWQFYRSELMAAGISSETINAYEFKLNFPEKPGVDLDHYGAILGNLTSAVQSPERADNIQRADLLRHTLKQLVAIYKSTSHLKKDRLYSLELLLSSGFSMAHHFGMSRQEAWTLAQGLSPQRRPAPIRQADWTAPGSYLAIRPQDLPLRTQTLLKQMGQWENVSRYIVRIIFSSQSGRDMKTMGKSEGGHYSSIGLVTIDTDGNGRSINEDELAAILVHEASHAQWAYDYYGNDQLLQSTPNERAAFTSGYRFGLNYFRFMEQSPAKPSSETLFNVAIITGMSLQATQSTNLHLGKSRLDTTLQNPNRGIDWQKDMSVYPTSFVTFSSFNQALKSLTQFINSLPPYSRKAIHDYMNSPQGKALLAKWKKEF